MRGDGFGGFDEDAIRAGLRAMRQADRMRMYVLKCSSFFLVSKLCCCYASIDSLYNFGAMKIAYRLGLMFAWRRRELCVQP